MASWQTVNVPGNGEFKVRTPDPTGSAGAVINNNFKAIQSAFEAFSGRVGTRIYYGQVAGQDGGSNQAIAGDFFLDVDDGALYVLVGTSWTFVVQLKGSDGQGFSSAAINTNGELIFTRPDSSTLNLGVVKGAQGTPGINGTNGTNGAAGPAGPAGAAGLSVTNATVNASGQLVLTMSDTSTINAGTVRGEQGPQGAPGSATWATQTSNDTQPNITLADGTAYNLTNSAISRITLNLTSGATLARVMFLSGATAPTLDVPEQWTWIGDNCDEGVFTPVELVEYDLIIELTPRGVIATAKGWK